MKNYPFVSIIIPALNEGKYIEKCICSLQRQSYPKNFYEIIVADNGSEDKTVDIARKLGATVYIKKGGTISSLRNFGVSKAKGGIYAFVDADCMVTEDWLKEAVNELSDTFTGATGSNCEVNEESTWIEKSWAFNRVVLSGRFETNWLQSANLIVKKEAFDLSGGFDDTLSVCEDSDLCHRILKIGYKIIYNHKINAIHLRYPNSIIMFFKKDLWHGKDLMKAMKKNENKIKYRKIFLFSLYYLFLTLLFVFSCITLNASLSLAIGGVMIFTSFVFALRSSLKNKMFKYLLPLTCLYVVFGLARGISLLNRNYFR